MPSSKSGKIFKQIMEQLEQVVPELRFLDPVQVFPMIPANDLSTILAMCDDDPDRACEVIFSMMQPEGHHEQDPAGAYRTVLRPRSTPWLTPQSIGGISESAPEASRAHWPSRVSTRVMTMFTDDAPPDGSPSFRTSPHKTTSRPSLAPSPPNTQVPSTRRPQTSHAHDPGEFCVSCSFEPQFLADLMRWLPSCHPA